MHTLPQQLMRMARYNAWANELIASVFTTVPAEWMDHELKSSFTSIRKTVNHLYGAEMVWTKRMQGISPMSFPESDYPAPAHYHQSSQVLLDFLQQQPDSFFTSTIHYSAFNGQAYETPVTDVLQHLFNHGSFHRGQLITMLRACGFEGKLPATDFIAWQRIHG